MKQSHEGGYSRATAALTDFAKRYNMTLDKLLEMSRSTLDAEVASILFG